MEEKKQEGNRKCQQQLVDNMVDTVDGKTVHYHRRLNRTPEKQFENLPETEKKLMCTMRGALENIKNKVIGMEDEMEEKEKIIEAERSQRKEAEKRLRQFLVDPYSSREINTELRHRLPRAKKADPLADQEDLESAEDWSSEVEEQATKSRHHKDKSKSLKAGSRKKKKISRVLTEVHFRDQPDGAREVSKSSSEEEEEEQRPRSKPRSKGKGRQSSEIPAPAPPLFSPLHPPPLYPPGGLGYPVGQYTTPMYRPINITPWSSLSSFGYPSGFGPGEEQAIPQPARLPQSRSLPLLNEGQAGDVGSTVQSSEAASKRLSASMDTGLNTVDNPSKPDNHASHDTVTSESISHTSASLPRNSANQKPAVSSDLHSHSASSISSHYGLPASLSGGGAARHPFLNVGVPLYPAPPTMNSLGPAYPDLTARTTCWLHEEIARLKVANERLTETLGLKSQEIETLKLQILAETHQDDTLDTDAARKFAELMAEVKTAENRRENAMATRMSQLEEDRVQLMRQLESICQNTSVEENSRPGRKLCFSGQESTSESETEDSEEEMVASSKKTPPMVGNPDAMRVTSLKDALKELERRHQKELQIYREELQVVMEQRDQALDQLQDTKQESKMQHLRLPGQREQILMAKVSALQREKDKAENTVRQLMEERMETELFGRLWKTINDDCGLNDNTRMQHTFNNQLRSKLMDHSENDPMEKKVMEDKEGRFVSDSLSEQLRLASRERSLLEMKCHKLESECNKEKEEKNRLERLNGVLRKKLIAVSTSANV